MRPSALIVSAIALAALIVSPADPAPKNCAAIQSDLNACQSTVNALRTQVDSLNAEVSRLLGDLSAVETELATTQSQLTTTQAELVSVTAERDRCLANTPICPTCPVCPLCTTCPATVSEMTHAAVSAIVPYNTRTLLATIPIPSTSARTTIWHEVLRTPTWLHAPAKLEAIRKTDQSSGYDVVTAIEVYITLDSNNVAAQGCCWTYLEAEISVLDNDVRHIYPFQVTAGT